MFQSKSILFFPEFLNPFLNHCKCLPSYVNSETHKPAAEEEK